MALWMTMALRNTAGVGVFYPAGYLFHKLHDFPPRPSHCHGKDIPHGGQRQCAARQHQSPSASAMHCMVLSVPTGRVNAPAEGQPVSL